MTFFLLLRLGNKKGMHTCIFVSTHSPEDVFLLSFQPFTCTGINFEYFKKLKKNLGQIISIYDLKNQHHVCHGIIL